MIKEFIQNNIVQYGDFQLKSGKQSNVYLNLKNVISFPELHGKVSDKIATEIMPDVDLICGTPYGAISFTSYISITKNIPMIFLRKETKEYGTKKLIEGNYSAGQKVVLIEDVITTGNSVRDAAKILEKHGLKVVQIITVFSRSDDLSLQYNTIPIEYLYHLHDLIPTKKTIQQIIREKKTNICLAADMNNIDNIFDLINKVGKNICILKIHSDMIVDFHDNYLHNRNTLNELKRKYQFKIWEDRKFADIGHIMKRQINNRISEWADIISVHPISGKKSIEELQDIDIILIGEMSTEGHLFNETYQQQVLDIGETVENVIGIVCQHKMSEQLLHIVPGISIHKTGDSQGQQYNTPNNRNFADIFVIGRGIYEAEDPLKEIGRYQTEIFCSK
jgi:uridine monophosphate synthetase